MACSRPDRCDIESRRGYRARRRTVRASAVGFLTGPSRGLALSDHDLSSDTASGDVPVPGRVLLVDDDVDIRHLVGLYLGRGDLFEIVGEANDGIEAVELAEQLQPDVVILDVMMPRMSGHEAIPELLAVSPASMIVMLSALAADGQEAPALNAGAFAYVEKTTITLDFAEQVHELLGRFRRALGGESVWVPEYHPSFPHR